LWLSSGEQTLFILVLTPGARVRPFDIATNPMRNIFYLKHMKRHSDTFQVSLEDPRQAPYYVSMFPTLLEEGLVGQVSISFLVAVCPDYDYFFVPP